VAFGAVAAVSRWPVKSMGGEPLPAARLGEHGLAGDRARFVVDLDSQRVLTASQAPGLLRWSATYPPHVDLQPAAPSPEPTLTGADGRRWAWSEPGLAEALGADLGRRVELRHSLNGEQDIADTILVTVEASLAALDQVLDDPSEPDGHLDLNRFRPNLHVDLDAPPHAELAWTGRRLAVGDEVLLEVVELCERCAIPTRAPGTGERWPELLRHIEAKHDGYFGFRAKVCRAGVAEVGAPVRLLND
jgi:MOSC domain-containing protein